VDIDLYGHARAATGISRRLSTAERHGRRGAGLPRVRKLTYLYARGKIVTRNDDQNGAARPRLIRTLNEQLLLERLRGGDPRSRGELAGASGLSKPTVSLALASLERDGLVRHAGRRAGGRGRTASLYEIRRDVGFVLGLDVGREFIRGAVADASGVVRTRESRRVGSTSGLRRVRELAALGEELLAVAGVSRRETVMETVVGSPGVMEPGGRALRLAANLPGWERAAVLQELRRLLGSDAMVENDVDAAAVAERDHGHGRSVSTFAFVSVGTGIGMGLVIDGRLHRGAHGAAGEIAFLPETGGQGDPRDLRRRGALESAASSAALVRAARAAGSGWSSARSIFAAAAAGDRLAGEIVAGEAAIVARALAAIVAVADPELIVLGGGIGRAAGFAEAVAERLAPLAPVVPDVRPSALGEDAVVDGCLALGGEQLWARVLGSRAAVEP
jgi:predicted NBD/HSP70 family sugar kinase/DNA-binding MarR family transcriptional regulator